MYTFETQRKKVNKMTKKELINYISELKKDTRDSTEKIKELEIFEERINQPNTEILTIIDEYEKQIKGLENLIVWFSVETCKMGLDYLSNEERKITNIEAFPGIDDLPENVQKLVRIERYKKYGNM